MLNELREFYAEFCWMTDDEFVLAVVNKLEKLKSLPQQELTTWDKKRIKLIPKLKALIN